MTCRHEESRWGRCTACGMTWEEQADDTPYGRGGDHCPWCAADWKRPHAEDCPVRPACEYPPGCDRQARPGYRLCTEHYNAISALLGDGTQLR